MGACPVELSPEAHDLLLAASSHLPHVVAAALVHTAAGTAREGRSALELVGGGFRDATRIAQGSAELWTAILRQNRVALLEAMEAFLAALEAFRRAMESEDPSDLKKWLDTAAQLRSQLKPDHSKDEHGSRDSS
ncbi:MAG: hypothetical protein KatS3mg115_0638 [Candidatus Poribacteria bacterium]|nr:MAG: hypothetical protein KatS3mg115_0638 [Candidatus Poribacteria bacterium]